MLAATCWLAAGGAVVEAKFGLLVVVVVGCAMGAEGVVADGAGDIGAEGAVLLVAGGVGGVVPAGMLGGVTPAVGGALGCGVGVGAAAWLVSGTLAGGVGSGGILAKALMGLLGRARASICTSSDGRCCRRVRNSPTHSDCGEKLCPDGNCTVGLNICGGSEAVG